MKVYNQAVLWLILLTAVTGTAYAQKPKRPIEQGATTDSGRRVILRSDGSWVYAPKEPTQPQTEDAGATERKKKLKTIKEVETDLVGFLETEVVINGVIELDNYYNFGYSDATLTHFCFVVWDGTGRAYVYMSRYDPAATNLRSQLLAVEGSKLRASITVLIPSRRFKSYQSQLLADVVDYGPPL